MEQGYSVVLPTFQECENLKRLIPRLIEYFERGRRRFEAIVVDDNSRDGTVELVRSLRREHPIRAIVRTRERGVATAVIAGTDAARLSTIVHMDSDLVHTVPDLERLIEEFEMRADTKTVVIGSRYHPDSIYRGKPPINRLASAAGRAIVRRYLRLPVVDSSNNFRVFSKQLWQAVSADLITEGNVFFIHFLFLAHRQGASFVELPTTYMERFIGSSKLNVPKQTLFFFRSLLKDFK
jgi:dolichol-phosphate mannosyltransferase